ncbi:AraC family transcriptional regulator [Mobilicoccus pelagius]|uniref:Putative AraC family transcriptional regulator n=1 Tax=Mobilicoccus pelagius NBRC 104925 TaxID=1089455 RepID=H5UVS0_9MICO|nr:AraC family transcriptional regulator [Mobilicoccus pelagius]GAB49828.1 putative AraC family transcriptional regulator [Mobilicoccus pelagius NBRC 104925]
MGDMTAEPHLLTSELRAATGGAMLDLLDDLTTTMFCVKDTAGLYVAVNTTFVHRAGKRSRREVLGRSAAQLFVPELAERYETQDRTVMETGRSLHHELELISARGGRPRWFLTNKVPLRHEGRVVGLASLSQDVGADAVDDPAMTSLTRVVEHIAAHVGRPIRVPELADVAGCSVDTLERRVRRVFHRSPGQLVLTTRIDRATALLRESDLPLADVAGRCGFYDQAAFTRTFARLTGRTPAQFRRDHA